MDQQAVLTRDPSLKERVHFGFGKAIHPGLGISLLPVVLTMGWQLVRGINPFEISQDRQSEQLFIELVRLALFLGTPGIVGILGFLRTPSISVEVASE